MTKKATEYQWQMVAISLYRGNLHKVPDVPRRWYIPPHKFSFQDFKSLLKRRSRVLSRVLSVTAFAATSSKPNWNVNGSTDRSDESLRENGAILDVSVEVKKVGSPGGIFSEVKDDGGGCLANSVDRSDLAPNSTCDVVQESSHPSEDGGVLQDENPAELVNPNLEANTIDDKLDAKNKRKREIEDKLEILNAKKHNLVLVLKQILNVEEELKRQNDTQGTAIRPPVPLQVDVTADSGSMIRQTASRISLEKSVGGDIEGGEADDLSNPIVLNHHMLRTSSMSPSSESPLRRPYIQHNMASHTTRGSLGAAGSPSRFAPTGYQGHSTNLSTQSLSTTNCMASSPSPAASGGTSVFRDVRQPSPWN